MLENKAVSVVTGSAAQVPKEVAEELGIIILPLSVYVDGKEYHDGIDISPSELYQKMRLNQMEVKTAAPTVGQYYQAFKNSIEGGAKEILCVTLSSKLSADYSSAKNAANLVKTEYPESKVFVFDSRRAAVPQGLLTIEAAERLNAGQPMEDVLTYLENAWQKSSLIAALDTLEYLNRGGRIGQAAIYVGSTLRILPIVYLNDEGIVTPAAILRGKNKIIPTLVSQLQKRTEGYQKIRLAVMHADAHERAEELKEDIEAAFPGVAVPIDEFTPVMGAHAGPGLLGLGYLYE
jgi:DegV family protein with EDD domain